MKNGQSWRNPRPVQRQKGLNLAFAACLADKRIEVVAKWAGDCEFGTVRAS
jgi:hypothetical protein